MSDIVLESTEEYKIAHAIALANNHPDASGWARCVAGNFYGKWAYTYSQWDAGGRP